MSFRHSNAVREIAVEEFESHTQRYVMIETAHLSDNTGLLRYSQAELARVIGLSRITVAKEMKLLEGKGLLKKEKHGQYRVNILMPKEIAREQAQEEETDDLGEFSELEEILTDYLDTDGTYRTPYNVNEPIPGCLKRAVAEGIIKEREIPACISEPYGVTGFYHIFDRIKPLA